MSAQLKTLTESLRAEFSGSKPNLDKCNEILQKLKLVLAETSLLAPLFAPPSVSQQDQLLARETLEIGACVSVRCKNVPSFERYYAQLVPFYTDLKLPASPRMQMLIGLNLLHLLSQNRIAEFHAVLETLDVDILHKNAFIHHPVQLEQCMMEGSFSKVWAARSNVPAPEYQHFMDILMDTIRNEIADCSERAYTILPLRDAATLLHFKNNDELLAFAKERQWNVDQKNIYFHVETEDVTDIPTAKIITNTLNYAKELETIV